MSIQNINDKSKYDGYFCKKCNSIPLIQIIPKDNITKILSSCKCHKQYENIETFIQNKSLKEKIDINKISNQAINNFFKETEIDIKTIKQKFEKAKNDLLQSSNELKNKLIKLYKEKKKEVDELYNKYIKRNNIIIEVLEKIIESNELIKNNPSNIQNLLNNCIFENRFRINSLLETFKTNLEEISKKLGNYFKQELIVSHSIIDKSIKKEKLTDNFYCAINNFIEIDENICAWCSKYKSYISIMSPFTKDSYILNFTAHIKYINCMMKANCNNLISSGDDGFIKVWPLIDTEFINLNLKKGKNDIKSNKVIDINIEPILKYSNEYKDMKKLEKLINLKDNQFLAHSTQTIFLFKYSIKENKAEINLLYYYEYSLTPTKNVSYKFLNDIVDIVPIIKDKKEIIALCMKSYIHFLNLPNFDLITTINVKSMKNNCLIQINKNEILIVDNIYYLKIIDMNSWKIKLNIKKSSSINILLKLFDGTILYSGFDGIKRFNMKTMEDLPDLLKLNDDIDDYYYDEYFRDDIIHLCQLKNGTIIACFQNGMIKSFKLDI